MPNWVINKVSNCDLIDFMNDKGWLKDENFSFESIIPAPSQDKNFDLYTFHCDEWGCKWDAQDVYYNVDDGDLAFSTPWSTPMGVWKKIYEISKIPFEVEFADEDYGNNCGTLIFNEENPSGFYEQPDDPFYFAINAWDCVEDYLLDENGGYHHFDGPEVYYVEPGDGSCLVLDCENLVHPDEIYYYLENFENFQDTMINLLKYHQTEVPFEGEKTEQLVSCYKKYYSLTTV